MTHSVNVKSVMDAANLAKRCFDRDLINTRRRPIMINEMRHFIRLVEDAGFYAFNDRVEEIAAELFAQYRSRRYQSAPWPLIPAQTLISVWQQAARDGFVRNASALAKIVSIMIDNTARLSFNTDMAEHGTSSTAEVVERFDLELEEDEQQAFVEWLVDTDHGWRISDYGLAPLTKLAAELLDNPSDDDVIPLVDRMLQVTHQRSDLASWFVQGGTATLNRLFDATQSEDGSAENNNA